MFDDPSVADFKEKFARDFPYGATTAEVMDADIESAFEEVDVFINQDLFDTQAAFTLGYLYLAAHYLVMNLRASSQGVAGKYSWLQSGRGVGSVSESIAIPDQILAHPQLSILSQTNYGVRFLTMVLPTLTGNVFSVEGGTNP